MKKKLLFWLTLAMALPIAAQTGADFIPNVSRLRGEPRNNLVRISWEDSPDARGPVYLFRSLAPFGGEGPAGLRPAEIPYGIQSFVDELEAGQTYYYFAAASDGYGNYYNVPIPDVNIISVSIAPDAPAARPAVSQPELRRPAGISSLEAAAHGGTAIISFDSVGVKSAALYRSVRPIAQTTDLLGAVIVQTGVSSPYMDNPVPGIPYYYAVIAEEDLTGGTVNIVPGINTTSHPVVISGTGAPAYGMEIRAIPLPQISAQGAIPGLGAHVGTPAAAELSPEAAMALSGIVARPQGAPALRKPQTLAGDLAAGVSGGEEYSLSQIVRGPFSAGNWEAAKNELLRFLALPRKPENTGKARFYLGQCRYFLRQGREGLFEFLAAHDIYPAESMEWIQASLDMIKNQGRPPPL